MDCRTARTLMINEGALTPDEQQTYRDHLATCPACRDDQADPLGHALVQTTLEMALPPPDFTLNVLKRLPKASPLELAQQAARQQRRRWASVAAGTVAVATILALVGAALQPLWAGTALGLTAQIVRDVAAAAAVPLIVMLVGAIVIALLLQTILQWPTSGRTLGAGALAIVLLAFTGLVVQQNDQRIITAGSQGATAATILSPLHISDTIQGNVASLGGDIVVNGSVSGNIGTIVGSVQLQPNARIGGDVLVGTGQITNLGADVAGAVRYGPGAAALGQALGSNGASQYSAGAVRGLAGLLGALITLALAALVVMLWPDRTLRTSRIVPAQPWAALGLGVLITVLLALLALPVLALLAVTVVGLLLVPLLLMLVHLPYVQGLAAVGQALGQRLTGAVTIQSALWGVAAQLVLVIGLGLFSPIAGLTAFYLLASLGLGAQVLERRRSS